MRLALIEANHWHVPLYLDAIERSGARLVATCDSTGQTGTEFTRRFGSRSYPDLASLLSSEKLDYAFVFGRHLDMPSLADQMIAQRIPFMLEKPCGVRSSEVVRIARAAEAAGLHVAIPFIFRLSDLGRALLEGHAAAPSGIDHASFRFLAGPPQRYLKAGVPWMLDEPVSGGGPLINVGIHFVDLFRQLARDEIVSVSAEKTQHINGLSIEDFIAVRMSTRSGRIGTLECGYTFPSEPACQRELTVSVRSPCGIHYSAGEGLAFRTWRDGIIQASTASLRLETDIYYADVVEQCLATATSGEPPFAGLEDVAAAMRIIEAAYASANRSGAPVSLVA